VRHGPEDLPIRGSLGPPRAITKPFSTTPARMRGASRQHIGYSGIDNIGHPQRVFHHACYPLFPGFPGASGDSRTKGSAMQGTTATSPPRSNRLGAVQSPCPTFHNRGPVTSTEFTGQRVQRGLNLRGRSISAFATTSAASSWLHAGSLRRPRRGLAHPGY